MVELSKIFIPLLAVFLGGLLAFWQLNYRNKQERKNKWKDDFRECVAEYTELAFELNGNLLKMTSENLQSSELLHKVELDGNRLMGVVSKIEMLMDEKKPHYKEIMACFKRQQDWHYDALHGKKEKFQASLIYDFHFIAKKIYREY